MTGFLSVFTGRIIKKPVLFFILISVFLLNESFAEEINLTAEESRNFSFKSCLDINYYHLSQSQSFKKYNIDNKKSKDKKYVKLMERREKYGGYLQDISYKKPPAKYVVLHRYITENAWDYYLHSPDKIFYQCMQFYQSESLLNFINNYIIGDKKWPLK